MENIAWGSRRETNIAQGESISGTSTGLLYDPENLLLQWRKNDSAISLFLVIL